MCWYAMLLTMHEPTYYIYIHISVELFKKDYWYLHENGCQLCSSETLHMYY